MPSFFGKYKMVEHQNCAEYCRALGVNVLVAKFAAMTITHVTLEIKECPDDGSWILRSSAVAGYVRYDVKFQFGVWVEDKLMDGRKCRSKFTLEETNKLVQTSVIPSEGESEVTFVREFDDEGFSFIGTYKGVSCTGKAKKLS